jgi:hypothetical protein
MDLPDTTEMTTTTQNLNLLDLPSELHIQIASFLSYPDALALKHSCRHFYSMVYTGVHLKVNWLVERFERKLECPMEKCSFRTDEAFCNWRIRRIMERRRQHLECRRAPGGCWVVEGQTCHTDLVPLWLKGQGPRRVVRSLTTLVHEGGLLSLRCVDDPRLTWCIILALLICFFAMLLEGLWRLTKNQVVNWLAHQAVADWCASLILNY